MQLQAHGDGVSVAARAEGVDPRVDRFRAMFEQEKLTALRAGGL
jgi:hypothetical protein